MYADCALLAHGCCSDYPRFKGIDEGVSRDGGRIVFLLRLSPLLPFSLLNYALGG